MKRIFFFFFFLILITYNLSAQDDDYVISNPDIIEKKVVKPKPVKDLNAVPNPDFTNYFLTSTAYTLKKKNFRLSGTDILFIKASYGISNNAMASVNVSLFGTVAGTIKQQINVSEDIKFGVTVSGGRLFYIPLDTSIYYGGGQALASLGDTQDNITIGTGFYYIRSTFDIINEEKELFIHTMFIGAQKQISRKMYIMGEVIYFSNYKVITGAIGVKVVVGDRISLNFGIMPLAWNEPGSNQFMVLPGAIPLISFRMLLGKD
jgi:hypothetical protein